MYYVLDQFKNFNVQEKNDASCGLDRTDMECK
jgi:hypothetical protein